MYVYAKMPQYTDLCVKWNHIRLIRYFPRVIDRFIKFAKFPESVPAVALFYDTVRDVQHFDVVNVKSLTKKYISSLHYLLTSSSRQICRWKFIISLLLLSWKCRIYHHVHYWFWWPFHGVHVEVPPVVWRLVHAANKHKNVRRKSYSDSSKHIIRYRLVA